MTATRVPSFIDAPGSVTLRSTARLSIYPHEVPPSLRPMAPGLPVAIDSAGHVRPVQLFDTSAEFAGIAVRPFAEEAASGTPAQDSLIGVMRAGFVRVKVTGAAAPIKGSPAYVRTVADPVNPVVGGIEAGPAGSNSYQIPGGYFTGPADSDGIAELALNV